MKRADEKEYQVNGRVVDANSGLGIPGLQVEAFDKDLIFEDLVGSAQTDFDGRFRIEFTGTHFRQCFLDRDPDLFFRIFSGSELLKSTEASVLWNVRSGLTPIEIALPSEPTEARGAIYTVSGSVASPDRAGLGGLRVQIVDKNVGEDVLLTETVTDERGRYQTSFAAPSLRARGKTQPDLQARVFAGQELLGASEQIRYDATTTEILNVKLPANAAQLPSEHETLLGAVGAHYNGRLGDLKESDDRQDITYLANKTGWDGRAVALAALADQFAHQGTEDREATQIDPAFYYALFRAGLPANPDTLYQADPQTVQRIWKQAIKQGVIPEAMDQRIDRAVESFQRLSAQKLLAAPALSGASSFKELLTASRLEPSQQQRFAELYSTHRTNMTGFWEAVGEAFGAETSNRLQVDGKLGFLTINNAPLMQELHRVAGDNGLSDPVQLAQAGYHRAAKWSELLNGDFQIPKEIPGATLEARRANYAEYLAAQLRLSYPTAAVAQMVKSGDIPLTGAAEGASDQVHAFLTENQGEFEIGTRPVQQYIARNNISVARETVAQVKRLERVYQITPNDQAISGLMNRGIDAAYHVVRYDKEAFVKTFAQDLGGAETAAQTYDKSIQIHNAVLNVAIGFLTAKDGIALGSRPLQVGPQDAGAPEAQDESSEGAILEPMPEGPQPENAADLIAYPTLEGLFGEMDFCACDHCRSILSPAAYLVDLLLFIDQQGTLEPGKRNPLTVLLERRPDVQHLPLTCENTNTALPYIDVVNETLEYYIANDSQKLSLKDFVGHDTNGAASEDLLASPQFVMDSAYATLQSELFPAPLPFHQPLENLRRYFEKFEVRLPDAMERLRKTDDMERGANPYGWRDTLMEELKLSRAEHEILTDGTLTLREIYGFPAATNNAVVIDTLSNAKNFTRRVEITYDDIVSILQTRFINPNGDLIPKLERLGVSFATLKDLKDATITDAAFDALLPTGAGALDPVAYGGDIDAPKNDFTPIRDWIRNDENFDRIMELITLVDPTGNPDPCRFDTLEFRHAQPMTGVGDESTRLSDVEFARLLRFIRLWKKLGWTIEQTDAAICALYRTDLQPLGPGDLDTLPKLDVGFLNLLPRLGIAVRVMKSLNLTTKRDLLPLLACWSEIGTHGIGALYQQMFLNPSLLKQDSTFADNGFGEFLQDNTQKLAVHAEALRSAFTLTGDEYDRIIAALKFDANTALTLANISAVHRHGYLARKLRLSVREFLLLANLTGLDPFAAPDPTNPAILRLISLVDSLKERSLKIVTALYLIWNQDLSGRSAPDPLQVTEFARTLRADFAAIEDQFSATEDPGGDIARARMTLVYGQVAADSFFTLLDDTLVLDVAYTHTQPTLEAAITAADSKIGYDDFRHRLTHTGLLNATARNTLNALAGVTGQFQAAVNALFARSEDAKGSFFSRYPELKPLYDVYIASVDPPAVKRSTLLAAFKPELSRRRKRQQAQQRLSAATSTDLTFTQTILDPPAAPYPLHANGQANQPALNDLLALEAPGLAAQFFFRDTATGAVDLAVPAAQNLDYSAGRNPLPANLVPANAISGVWRGQIETPEAGFYNIIVEADAGATVTLSLGGQVVALTQNGTLHRNTDPLELKAGALNDIVLTVERVRSALSVKWETPKRAREIIPARYLYPPAILEPFSDTYIRFLKVSSLASELGLTANEIAHFATHADYQIAGEGWMNVLPVRGNPNPPTAMALVKPFEALLGFARIKAAISPSEESLLTAIEAPAAATQNADSLLFTMTRWDPVSLTDLLNHFGGNIAGLANFALFSRIYEAFALIQKMGISASALIKATTNEPAGTTVRDLQAALRARYDAGVWREVVQPINDEMRGLQRDALVAYILHQMRSNPTTEHIDTADKLFEYFLMDVEMEPCMQTSRIRHALSSVQLFIERCLMNLETSVSPSSINAEQWEWMKRYRVWEANRKIFLFPENWLEPELRDDKSPFFKEIESELLQGDITEDSATSAFMNYLSKLEEVAKLEPCGIYHIARDDNKDTGEIDHIIARTSGAHRKYYYRRYEYGYWTPWELIKLDIDDNPVIPVVWNGRLLLFWLRILKQTPIGLPATPTHPTGPNGQEPNLGSLKLSAVKADAKNNLDSNVKITVHAALCWSEYYNGKWQPTKTSDLNRPTELGQFAPNAFDPTRLRLSAFEDEFGGALGVGISGQGGSSFFLYNTHSLPLRESDAFPLMHLVDIGPSRFIDTSTDNLNITYGDGLLHLDPDGGLSGRPLDRAVLTNSLGDRTVEPRHPMTKPWEAPFFYEDSRNVFFVTTTELPVPVGKYPGFGFKLNLGDKRVGAIPPLILKAGEAQEVGPQFWGNSAPVGPDPGFIDPAPIERFVSEDAHILRGIGTTGAVNFGGRQIGPSGAITNGSSRK